MKKKTFLLIAFSILWATDGYCQSFKPVAGSRNLEVQFAPMNSSPIVVPAIRYRHFLNESTALRTTALMSYNRTSQILRQADPENDIEALHRVETDLLVFLSQGIEKHLEGTDRLSPYFGAEMVFSISNSVDREERDDFFDEEIYTDRFGGAVFSIGLNGIAGADFYICPKLYLGLEFGYGFILGVPSVGRTSSDDPDFQEQEFDRPGSFRLGMANSFSQIRLGYFF